MNTRSHFPSLDPVPEIPPFPLPVTVFLQMQIMGFTLPCLTRGECNSRCGLRVQHQPLLWGTLTLGHPGNTSLVQNTAGHKCKKKGRKLFHWKIHCSFWDSEAAAVFWRLFSDFGAYLQLSVMCRYVEILKYKWKRTLPKWQNSRFLSLGFQVGKHLQILQ